MKRFGFYIALILLVSVLILSVLDLVYTYTYVQGTPRNKISHLLSKENETIDHVFIGSSRVDNSIDAELVESITNKKAINLGIQGAKLDDSFLLVQLLEKQEIKTEIIFIQVDYTYNFNDDNSEILKSSLMPYIREDPISEFLQKRDEEFLFLKYFPFYRYLKYDYQLGFREFLNTAIGNKPRVNLKNGYFPKQGNNGRPLKGNLPSKILDENKNISAINSFAEKHDMKIIYFMAPYCTSPEETDFPEELSARIEGFLDFSGIFTDKKEYFFDCGHLNDRGAKEFSKIFAKKIEELSL